MNRNPAPVLLFVYNRPNHTRQVVEALLKNDGVSESELYIYSDAPRNEASEEPVREVREYIRRIEGFRKITIREHPENRGCDRSIREGVSEIISRYGRVIVLEDDILTVSSFLRFMNEALELYETDKRIWSVAGYSPQVRMPAGYPHDIYLVQRSASWGWGSWKDRWEKIDWQREGEELLFSDKEKMQSFCRAGDDLANTLISHPEAWDITNYYTQWKSGTYSVLPVKSLVQNIGIDGSGTHFVTRVRKYEVETENRVLRLERDILPDPRIEESLRRFHSKPKWRSVMVSLSKKWGIYDWLYKHFG